MVTKQDLYLKKLQVELQSVLNDTLPIILPQEPSLLTIK